MPVAEPFINVEVLGKASSLKPVYEYKIFSRMQSLNTTVAQKEKAYKDALNALEKFKADVSNCMTEEDMTSFINSQGI